MDKDIIRIAEAMGYSREHSGISQDPFSWMWRDPNRSVIACTFNDEGCPFRPEISHDDCHALIEWLKSKGYRVRVDHRLSANGEFVEVWKEGTTNWKFGAHYDASAKVDYRLGVVELTLKILDSETQESVGE